MSDVCLVGDVDNHTRRRKQKSAVKSAVTQQRISEECARTQQSV